MWGAFLRISVFYTHTLSLSHMLRSHGHFASLLRSAKNLPCALSIHGDLLHRGLEQNAFLCNLLLRAYGALGALRELSSVFDSFPLHLKDHFSWNFAIRSFAENGKFEVCRRIFNQMAMEGMCPDRFILVGVLDAFEKEQELEEGRRLHACIRGTELETDTVVGTAFVNMYSKCGSLHDAEILFDKLFEQDVVSFNAMIATFDLFGKTKDAFQLFNQIYQQALLPEKVTFLNMLLACTTEKVDLYVGKRLHALCVFSEFINESSVGTAVISMYGKCGKVDDARRVFDNFLDVNTVLWTSIIAAHAFNGQGKESVFLFGLMRQKFVPDEIAFLSILAACSHAGLIDEGNYFLQCMKNETSLSSSLVGHYGCMIDLLGRAGQLDEAEALLENIPQDPSVGSYTALLGACRYRPDVACAERTANRAFSVGLKSSSPYVMLSNIYATECKLNIAE